MLFMVIEHFKPGAVQRIGERFRQRGRMLPECVGYQASWVDSAGGRCFQVMESPNSEVLNSWASRWDDLVNFEIVRVSTSSDFWSQQP